MIKWTKKDCMKAIKEMRSPIMEGQGQATELASSVEGMRAARPTQSIAPVRPPIGR